MAAEDVRLLADLGALAVMGVAEVLPRLPRLWRLERELLALLDGGGIDLVVPIDYPGFNLRIGAAARARGVTVLYYIAPKVWAWRPQRARKLAAAANRVAAILPFEVDFLRAHGVDATFVGHPLLDRPNEVDSREAFCDRWGLDPNQRLLAVLPGSRRQEVDRLLPAFVATAEQVRRSASDVLPVLARAKAVPTSAFRSWPFAVADDARALLRHSQAALVKSGTATLEAALEGTAHVIAYAMNPLTYSVAKRVVAVDHIGLPNLILGERAVPEYIQADARAELMAPALLELLRPDSESRERQQDAFGRVRAELGAPGAAARVADLAHALLAERVA